ncbi:MAG: DUF2911 domain-containing protein [Chitinophagaceae bacterium]
MKKIIVSFLIAIAITNSSFAQVKMPQPSSTQFIKQDFGMGNIELTYSRPNAKGRKIFGDLVPFNKIWRTGANAATRLHFNDAVEIGGKKIDTGSYVLYTIPGIDNWEIIINKGINNWGTDGYKEAEDVARFKVEPTKLKGKLETLTMQFADIKPESCTLQINWEKMGISIPFTTNIKDRLRVQIEAALQGDKKPFWQAAQFYNEYDKNLTKALENVSKGIEASPKAYWMYIYKAKIQKEMGDIAGAKESSMKSLALAKEEKNEDYVKINEEFLKKLK